MPKQITRNDIINFLREKKSFLNERFGVVEIGLFGSYANELQDENSDIDFLIELKEPRFEYLAGLQIFLEKEFNRKIELIRKRKNYTNRFLKSIEHNTIYV